MVGDDQSVAHSQALEIICHFVSSSGSDLDGRHLHGEDSFVGDVKATHSPLLSV